MANTIDQIFSQVQESLGNFDPSTHDIPELDLPKDDLNPFREEIELGEAVSIDEYEQVVNAMETIEGQRLPPSLSQENRRLIEGGIREAGLEILAFYKSRRDIDKPPYRGKWGIFYLQDGVDFVAQDIASNYPGYGNTRKLALELLRQHERHHYETDVFALMLESTGKTHLYEPLRFMFRGHRTQSVEEALANRRIWDWAKKQNIGLGDYAFDFMKCQPNAYARFDEPLIQLQSEYVHGLLNKSFGSPVTIHPSARWVVSVPKSLQYRSLCPEYIIYSTDLSRWIPAAFGFPAIVKIDDSENVVQKLMGKYAALKNVWDARKKLLQQNPMAKSLHFRLWDKKSQEWSVNVDGNFRAHLTNNGNGSWITRDIDNHLKMGHGK